MPIRQPGIFLSHPPIAINPSYPRQPTTVSIESAITSLETKEYFIPCVPIEIPSDTVIVLNKTPFPPDALIESSTTSESLFKCILHGVTLAPVEATPTRGLVKSSVVNPTPRSIEREAAWLGPSTRSLEYFLELIFKTFSQSDAYLNAAESNFLVYFSFG